MKQAVFIHTNAYDAILVPNGTMIDVTPDIFRDFISAGPDTDWTHWNGPNRWDDECETLDETAEKMRDSVVAYFEDGKLIIADPRRWEDRREFYLGE